MVAELNTLISLNRISEVLEMLSNWYQGENAELILLNSRFQALQADYRKGLLTNEEYSSKKNQLIKSLLEFIAEHEPSLRSQKKDSWETPKGIALSVKSKRENVKLVVRLVLEGMELDVEAPLDLTAIEFKNSLIEELDLPTHDSQGIPHEWRMIALTSNLVIRDELTLRECNIRDGEVVMFITGLVAGAPVDSLLLQKQV